MTGRASGDRLRVGNGVAFRVLRGRPTHPEAVDRDTGVRLGDRLTVLQNGTGTLAYRRLYRNAWDARRNSDSIVKTVGAASLPMKRVPALRLPRSRCWTTPCPATPDC